MAKATAITAIPDGDREAVYIWEFPVRLIHWLIFLSMGTLTFSGIYIGNPFYFATGEAGQSFIMGTMRAIHFYSAIVFTLSVLGRIWVMFTGNRWESWRQFIPTQRHRLEGLWATLKFYLFVDEQPPKYMGHNPLAGVAYTGVYVLYLVMIGTGLGLYAMSAHVDSPMRGFTFLLSIFGGAQSARWIHHVVMWLLLAFAAHHVASAMLVSRAERMGIMDSIFSGFKFVHPRLLRHLHDLDEETRPKQ